MLLFTLIGVTEKLPKSCHSIISHTHWMIIWSAQCIQAPKNSCSCAHPSRILQFTIRQKPFAMCTLNFNLNLKYSLYMSILSFAFLGMIVWKSHKNHSQNSHSYVHPTRIQVYYHCKDTETIFFFFSQIKITQKKGTK